jgi:membrane-associated protein
MLAHMMGPWLYALVFAIVFCETGLVVTPFLPGDSLLFSLGSLTALSGSGVELLPLSLLLVLATFLGDNVNYFVGKKLGPKIFKSNKSKLFNYTYLVRTKNFYEKHGKKAVILARFVPIVRTFAPFVAGIGQMPYMQYLGFSILGSILWTQSFLWAGNLFGELEVVKRNFQIVILVVIVLSVLPVLIGWYRSRREKAKLTP